MQIIHIEDFEFISILDNNYRILFADISLLYIFYN